MARRKNRPQSAETRRRRAKAGAAAVREIKRYQKSVEMLLSKGPFRRLVKEILFGMHGGPYRITPDSLEALQVVSEDMLVGLFQDSMLFAVHAKRVTVMIGDFQLALEMEWRSKGNGRSYAIGTCEKGDLSRQAGQ